MTRTWRGPFGQGPHAVFSNSSQSLGLALVLIVILGILFVFQATVLVVKDRLYVIHCSNKINTTLYHKSTRRDSGKSGIVDPPLTCLVFLRTKICINFRPIGLDKKLKKTMAQSNLVWMFYFSLEKKIGTLDILENHFFLSEELLVFPLHKFDICYTPSCKSYEIITFNDVSVLFFSELIAWYDYEVLKKK